MISTNHHSSTRVIFLFSTSISLVGAGAAADDWPQWLGPFRDSVWREQGIVEEFPDEGLPVKWRVPIAPGFSGPAVADGRVFVMDFIQQPANPSDGDTNTARPSGQERVVSFEAATGRQLWVHQYDCTYGVSYPTGPRCTPTVDGRRVYTLGTEGHLYCLSTANGEVLWSKDLNREYGASTPSWGNAAHPLVDEERLYCLAGGDGSVAVAFDKITGREIWRNLSAGDKGYCPPTMIEHQGRRLLVIWHPRAINGLDPATGEVYWSVPLEVDAGMSITMPRQLGKYLFASAIDNVGILLELTDDPTKVEIVWRGVSKKAIYCCNSTPFLTDGMMYGCDISTGALIGARLEDGERLWETRQPTLGDQRGRHGTAFIVQHGERFFLFNETGDLILARLSPGGYEEIDRFHVLEPTNEAFGRPVVWSHPAFAERCLFARNDEELVCVDLALPD